ncbi:MAG TPA: SBBP repeat-containing protein [Pyrinomonadaceae bacterium]|nr:SBBP repeat-containing protein [Pyrinomonadaceae bacterium]
MIAPVLSYASYLGGSRREEGTATAVDAFGNAYVAGLTESSDFPTVNSRIPGNDFNDVFVTKINAALKGMKKITGGYMSIDACSLL